MDLVPGRSPKVLSTSAIASRLSISVTNALVHELNIKIINLLKVEGLS